MKKLLIILLVLIANLSFAQNDLTSKKVKYITVEGEFETKIEPDEFYLYIVINENQDKKISLKNLEKSMMDLLEKFNINIKENLICVRYSTNIKKFLLKSSDLKEKKEYELKLSNPNITNKVIVALREIKIPNVSISKVESSKYREVKRKTLIEATKDARSKAMDLTSTLGVKLGKPLFIGATSSRINNPYRDNSYDDYEDDEVEMVEVVMYGTRKNNKIINFKKIKVSSKVEVVFQILD